MRTCKHCGQSLPNGTRFCFYCGKQIEADTRRTRKNGSGKILAISAIGLVALGVATLAVMFFGRMGPFTGIEDVAARTGLWQSEIEKQYREAERLWDRGELSEAQELYAEISGYRFSSENAEKCKKDIEKESKKQVSALMDSGAYSDVIQLITEKQYELQDETFMAEEYAQAEDQLLSSYFQQSDALIQEAQEMTDPALAYRLYRDAGGVLWNALSIPNQSSRQLREKAETIVLLIADANTKMQNLLDPSCEESFRFLRKAADGRLQEQVFGDVAAVLDYTTPYSLIQYYENSVESFRTSRLNSAAEVHSRGDANTATEICKEASRILGGDETLDAAAAEYGAYRPVWLSKLNPHLKSGCVAIYTDADHSRKDILEQRYVSSFTPIKRGDDYATTEDEAAVEYYLNGEYNRLTGTLYLPFEAFNVTDPTVPGLFRVYGDGVLLYEGPRFYAGMADLIPFDVNISGVKNLRIVIMGVYIRRGISPYAMVCAGNVAVSK